MNCALCGLPTPQPPVAGPGGGYCCTACSEVARLLGDAAAPVAARVPPTHVQGAEAFFHVDGMHCASCEQLIALVAARVDGVLAVSASAATGTAKVSYDPTRIRAAEIGVRLGSCGYRFRARGEAAPAYDERADLLRMLTGCSLASAVMMLSFVFVYPLHAGWLAAADYAALGWLAFVLVPKALFVLATVQVFGVGAPILRGATLALRVGGSNMDLLLALAIVSAYLYSVFALWLGSDELYFDVATGVVAVVTIGRFLERGAREEVRRELGRFLDAVPERACVVRAGECFFCGADELRPGDRLVVRAGETIAADGTIVDGGGAVDESLLTGEPFPAARACGERVLGGAVLRDGRIEVDVGDRVRSRIADLSNALWRAQAGRGGAPGRAERIAQRFVPLVLGLALLVGAAFLVFGASPQRALLALLATLIVSCPCTFGLAIPLTVAGATAAALRRSILVNRAEVFDGGARADIVAFDKTGTLSSGEMVVAAIVGPPEVAGVAAAVERDSPHPVARAIAQLDGRWVAREVQSAPGRGACAMVGARHAAVGSAALFERLGWPVPAALAAEVALPREGAGVVSYVGWDGAVHGAIVTRDEPRPGWEATVDALRSRGRVVLLTGAASAEGYGPRFDETYTGVPPEAKAAVVRHLRKRGRVAMVGDGSNDAAALAEADLAVAFGAPTALAAQAAAIVVTGERIERIADALDLVDAARRRIRHNLAWALSYNAIALPLAMTGLLNPLWAALAMTASSLLVVWNATRPLLSADGEAMGGAGSTRSTAVA